ncbi:MAG: serpin family protein [Myxococcales bacterium]|nr:serpin family protein [Myxococcales bacterium]MCB9628335.1 serpin family protein [Sandaracinaceae bacterium]
MSRRFLLLPLLGLALSGASAACAGRTSEPPTPTAERPAPNGPPGAAAQGQVEEEESAGTDVNVGGMMTRANAFGFELYQRVRGAPGNVVIAPISVHMALSMTYAGARADTAAEMQQVLHVDPADTTLHRAYRAVGSTWNTTTSATLRTANRLFAAEGLPLAPEFVALTRTEYDAPVELLDFAGAPDPSRRTINQWVAQRTEERIQELLPAGAVSPLTRLVLVNAIYFKSTWQTPFDASATEPAPFLVNGATEANVPMMRGRATFAWAELPEGLRILEMPYTGGDLSMILLLPNERSGTEALSGIEGALSTETLTRWRAAMSRVEVEVRLPRFRLEPPSMALAGPLRALGMPTAFGGEADFSGIAPPPGSLSISDVFHRAFIEVNEEGTEAAAATAVVMRARRAGPPPPSFMADHPFVFVLLDLRSGAVLFLGRVSDPR